MSTTHDRCLNCDRELHGAYCADCGQRVRALDPPVGQFLRSAVEELFAFDARLWRTLKPLVLKPGFVAREYLAGRRARYVPPFRLYLTVSVVMFIVLALVPDRQLFQLTSTGTDSTAVSAAADTLGSTVERDSTFSERLTVRTRDPEAFDRAALRWLNQIMFLLLPVFALLLKLTHRREPYVRHLIYAVYLHAFAFLVFTVTELPGLLRLTAVANGAGVLVLWIPIYFYLGLRRMYGESHLKTAAKAGFIIVTYLLTLLAGALLAAILVVLI